MTTLLGNVIKDADDHDSQQDTPPHGTYELEHRMCSDSQRGVHWREFKQGDQPKCECDGAENHQKVVASVVCETAWCGCICIHATMFNLAWLPLLL